MYLASEQLTNLSVAILEVVPDVAHHRVPTVHQGSYGSALPCPANNVKVFMFVHRSIQSPRFMESEHDESITVAHSNTDFYWLQKTFI